MRPRLCGVTGMSGNFEGESRSPNLMEVKDSEAHPRHHPPGAATFTRCNKPTSLPGRSDQAPRYRHSAVRTRLPTFRQKPIRVEEI
jgi:hypothetical protein